MNFREELNAFIKAFRNTSFPRITKTVVLLEMLANAVAALCGILVYYLLQHFVVVRSVKNLWGLAARKDRFLVSKTAFEWISGILSFVVALFVFTYIEELVTRYIDERRREGKKE